MKLLAIDSSGLVASVAVLEDEHMLAEYTIDYKKTHSQTLVPMLDEIKKMIDLDLSTIDAIAVAAGPGSFTGLRIGSATAKGLGLALNKPIISVPTMDAMAYNLCMTKQLVCTIMDARRGQVYAGVYEFTEGTQTILVEQCVIMLDELVDQLNQFGRAVVFLGDGVPVFKSQLSEIMKVPYTLAPAHLSRQRAGALGVLAMHYYHTEHGEYGVHIQKASEHKPNYLRLSQAERELAQKQQEMTETSTK